MRYGYTNIQVLPELTGKPWCAITQSYMHGLRPSNVRVVQQHGEIKSNAILWRVTVYLTDNERIERIEQEVEVELPDSVENGYRLHCLMEDL